MSWQIINVEPAFGICDQCKKHDCGIVDGQHKWVMTGIYDKSGDAIIIGYRCVELWAANMGISREVVEHTVLLTPTDEQIGDFVRNAVNTIHEEPRFLKEYGDALADTLNKSAYKPPIDKMNREQLKIWLKSINVDFVPQWGEERLREEALKHV